MGWGYQEGIKKLILFQNNITNFLETQKIKVTSFTSSYGSSWLNRRISGMNVSLVKKSIQFIKQKIGYTHNSEISDVLATQDQSENTCLAPEITIQQTCSETLTENQDDGSSAQTPQQTTIHETYFVGSDTKKAHYRSRQQEYIDVVYGSAGWEEDAPVWFIENLIYLGAVGMLAADTQAGKTFFALRLAQAIANGKTFAGLGVEQGSVLYIAAEGARGIGTRLRALEETNGSVENRIVFVKQAIDIRNTYDVVHLSDTIEDHVNKGNLPFKLMIIDTLSQSSWGLEENHSSEMSDYFKYCKKFADKHNIAILIVHHFGKNGDSRGSSVMQANPEFYWTLSRNEKESFTTILNVVKSKEGPTDFALRFKLEVCDTGLRSKWGNITTLRVCEELKVAKIENAHSTKSKPLTQAQNDARWLVTKLINEPDHSTDMSELRNGFQLEYKLIDSKVARRFKDAIDEMKINNLITVHEYGKSKRIQLTEIALSAHKRQSRAVKQNQTADSGHCADNDEFDCDDEQIA